MKKRALIEKSPDRLSIREKLGISQEHYAAFCGISKSLLSMIEIHKRDWPSGTKNNFAIQLAFFEAEKIAEENPVPEKLEKWQREKLDLRLLKLKVQCYKVETELEAMSFGYHQARRRLKTCKELRLTFTNPETIEGKLLDLWEHTARIQLHEKSLMEQELLQTQLDSIKKQIETLEKRLKQE
jgi:transcriptional regulator with XRE-family HTH domain